MSRFVRQVSARAKDGSEILIDCRNDETVVDCEECGHPFVIRSSDLACCRSLKALRVTKPDAMSPRAGAVLCPLDSIVLYQDRVASKKLPPTVGVLKGKNKPENVVDLENGRCARTHQGWQLFRSWLDYLSRSPRYWAGDPK